MNSTLLKYRYLIRALLISMICVLPRSVFAENTLSRSKVEFGSSLSQALFDTHTWVPMLGSFLVTTSGRDQAISDWASSKTPVFGSGSNARLASDQLNDLGSLNLFISSILLPVPEQETAFKFRAKQVVFSGVTIESNYLTTNFIKRRTNKLRPDASNRLSFPSGHTSRAAAQSTLSVANIKALPHLDRIHQNIWQVSTVLGAGLTGWARVEGQKHFTSDVLAGYALGNFFGQLANNMLLHSDSHLSFGFLSTQSFQLQLSYQW